MILSPDFSSPLWLFAALISAGANLALLLIYNITKKNKAVFYAFITLLVMQIGFGMYMITSGTQTKEVPTPATVTAPIEKTNSAQNDALTEIRFKLALLGVRGVHESFRDPLDKNKFYFVTYMDGPYGIWVYDLTKDKPFQEKGTVGMVSEGYTLLFSQTLAKFREFKGVGIIENKFVFAETSPDFSLGPCASSWSYPNLQYIDLGVSEPIRKSFTLPEDIKKLVNLGTTTCQQ